MATNLTVTLQKTQTEFQVLRSQSNKRAIVKMIFRHGHERGTPGVELQIDDEESVFILPDAFERVVNLYNALRSDEIVPDLEEFKKEIQARNDAAWKTLNPDYDDKRS